MLPSQDCNPLCSVLPGCVERFIYWHLNVRNHTHSLPIGLSDGVLTPAERRRYMKVIVDSHFIRRVGHTDGSLSNDRRPVEVLERVSEGFRG
jgi:hypothetical protein